MVFGAASCQKELATQKGDCKVSFNVVIPDEVATKAISDGKSVDELVWEVYTTSDNKRVYNGTVSTSTVNANNQTQFVLELNLVSNIEYNLLFWAQKSGTGYYYTSNLHDVYARYGSNITTVSNDENRDAFFGSLQKFNPGANVATHNTVTLKRPFAQINFASSPSDWAKAEPFINDVWENNKRHGLLSKVTLKDMYTRFNVLEGDVVGSNNTEVVFDYYMSPASMDGDSYNWDANNYISYNGVSYGWTAMNYVFAPKDGTTSSKVTAEFVHGKNDAETALVKEVFSVPFKQNYRTNILGEIFTGGNKFVVVVDANFNNPTYTIAEPLMLAFEHGGHIVLNATLDLPSALVLKGGKELTLDLNGYTITTTRDFWDEEDKVWSMVSAQDGAQLTIVDSKGNGAIIAKENDAYVFDVRGGSTLNIEGGKFVGNITAVQVENGTANIKGGHFSLAQLAPIAYGGDARFTLNCIDDAYRNNTAKINVTGGSFVNFNPADNLAEGAGTRFVPTEGYTVSEEVGTDGKTTYTVTKTATVSE